MRPILFSLGRLNFYSYGFFTALGFITAGYIVDYLAKKKKLITSKNREYFLIDSLLFSLVVGIMSARLGYILIYNLLFRLEPFDLHYLLSGGFVFYAGLLGGFTALLWWLRLHKIAFLAWFDVVIVGVMVGFTLSEIGGYLNDGNVIHLAGFVGGVVLSLISYQLVLQEKKEGHTFFYTLFLLFLLFFFLEFGSAEKVHWFGLSLTQVASLALMGGLGLLACAKQPC